MPAATARAGNKKKKGKKKPPPPLAFAVAVLDDEIVAAAGTLSLQCQIFCHHPGSLITGAASPLELVPFATFQDAVTAKVQDEVAAVLSDLGVFVPASRIAVTLLQVLAETRAMA